MFFYSYEVITIYFKGSIIEKRIDPAWSVKERNKNKVDGLKDTSPIVVIKLTTIIYIGKIFLIIGQ